MSPCLRNRRTFLTSSRRVQWQLRATYRWSSNAWEASLVPRTVPLGGGVSQMHYVWSRRMRVLAQPPNSSGERPTEGLFNGGQWTSGRSIACWNRPSGRTPIRPLLCFPLSRLGYRPGIVTDVIGGRISTSCWRLDVRHGGVDALTCG